MISRWISNITQNRCTTFLFLLIINAPLFIFTFDTPNWSDDYQLTNLVVLKAKISPILPLLFETVGGYAGGGHFGPVYNLFNIMIGLVSTNPIFFHCVVMVCFICTAYVLFLFVDILFTDKTLALISSTLFSLNYYTAFKALTWNTFHSHATNAFTGILCLYMLVLFMKKGRLIYLMGSCFFLLLSILNLESGFVFLPLALLITVYFWKNKTITFRLSVLMVGALTLTMLIFPILSKYYTGSAVPIGHRLGWSRNVQNYAFMTSELTFKSLGMSALYNHGIVNPLKKNSELKDVMIRILRENDLEAIKDIPIVFVSLFILMGIGVGIAVLYLSILAWTRTRGLTRLFMLLFTSLFFIYVVVFYRIDVANVIALFSSVICADLILSLIRDRNTYYNSIGKILIAMFCLVTVVTISNRFEDCYQKSFFGLSTVAYKGTDELYKRMNDQVGGFIDQGFVLFTHDYEPYSRTTGFERIGTMIDLGDYTSYNATVFSDEIINSDLVHILKYRSLAGMYGYFNYRPNHKHIIVDSKKEAVEYVQKHHIDLKKNMLLYITQDYQVVYLNQEII